MNANDRLTLDTNPKPVRLAAACLYALQAGQWNKAQQYLKRLNDECGGPGIYTALLAWSDAYTAHSYGEDNPPPTTATVNLVRADTGQLDGPDSDRVPAHIRWAARLIQARAAMDQERYNKIVEELPDNALERAKYVFAVADVAARTINGLPRGYGRMGNA